jgi:acyl-CoA thioesterase-1
MASRASILRLLLLFGSGLTACGSGEAAQVDPRGDSYQGGVGTAAPIARPIAPIIEDGPRIVFLGDSLAAGLHLSANQAFPAVLQRRLADEGLPFRLVNAGVSGDTTAGGLRRIDWILKQAPDWVVVELGGNDGLRGQPVEAIEANLRAIIVKIQAAGAGVVLLGQVMPPNYGPDYTREFRELFDAIAEDHDLVYVPFFLEGVGGVDELNLPDGIHPTPRGHELIAEKLEPTFRKLVRDSQGPP